MAFIDGRLPTECMWKMKFIIPKGSGDFRGIRIVDVLWNTLLGVIT